MLSQSSPQPQAKTPAVHDLTLRLALPSDFDFAFEAKRSALGPRITHRWGWDEAFQLAHHRARWQERPWSIILLGGVPVGTVVIDQQAEHIQFGEFYLLPAYQGRGIGSQLLRSVITQSELAGLPIALEYLQWNPVGSLYKRHGFVVTHENDKHYFMRRQVKRPA
jgi:GNAT superfamily N-acetyltransferase